MVYPFYCMALFHSQTRHHMMTRFLPSKLGLKEGSRFREIFRKENLSHIKVLPPYNRNESKLFPTRDMKCSFYLSYCVKLFIIYYILFYDAASCNFKAIQMASVNRPLVKESNRKSIFLISRPKHKLYVLKRTISMRRFF